MSCISIVHTRNTMDLIICCYIFVSIWYVCKLFIYVYRYDDQVDRVTKYQRILLDDLTLIEFGIMEHGGPVSLFKQSPKTGHHCIRLHYKVASVPGYYHMFRSTNLRFFNNMAVGIKTHEEMIGMDCCQMFLLTFLCILCTKYMNHSMAWRSCQSLHKLYLPNYWIEFSEIWLNYWTDFTEI